MGFADEDRPPASSKLTKPRYYKNSAVERFTMSKEMHSVAGCAIFCFGISARLEVTLADKVAQRPKEDGLMGRNQRAVKLTAHPPSDA
jgi:hypothetical protein